MNEWKLIELKNICTAKEMTDKMKRQPTEWEKIFANDMTNKGLISKILICKQFIQLFIQFKKSPSKNGQNLNRHSPKKTYRG